jgi:protein-tyrosine phosphatase
VNRVLVVCTANQCRSPLAAAVLSDRLHRLGLDLTVASAGTQAVAGLPATESTRAAAARIGLDLSAHRSRRTDPELVGAADLVLTMERHHLREVVVLDPSTFPRAFTLKEIVRRGDELEPAAASEPPERRLARVHAGRRPAELLGSSIDDDVEDPTGSAFADHESMAREVSELVDRLVEQLWDG